MEFWAQLISGGLALSLIAYIWYMADKTDAKEKAAIKEELKRVTAAADEHYKKCNEVPKSLLLEKLENLCEKQDEHQNENRKRFENLNLNIIEVFKRLNKVEIAVGKLEVKEAE